MKYLKVENWAEYQHYKDRDPVWIKLYRSLLDDYIFECLQDDSKLLLVFLWLLAAKLDNKIPYDLKHLSKKIPMKKSITESMVQALIKAGLISCYQDASKMIQENKTDAITEKRREEKNREEKEQSNFPDSLNTPEFKTAWAEWVKYRKQAKKPLTDLSIKKQLKKLSDLSVPDAIKCIDSSITNGWHGLFLERIKNDNRQTAQTDTFKFEDQESSYGITIDG